MPLIGVLFTPVEDDMVPDQGSISDSLSLAGGLMPPDEEQIPLLVDKFLQNVHTKNPVLDVEQLVKHARIIASRGLRWDAWSCLVLLASALGTIAKPFDAAVNVATSPTVERRAASTWIPDAPATQQELQHAESCFVLACRRLGGLKHSILGSQCYFFAGGKMTSRQFRNFTWIEVCRVHTYESFHLGASICGIAIFLISLSLTHGCMPTFRYGYLASPRSRLHTFLARLC